MTEPGLDGIGLWYARRSSSTNQQRQLRHPLQMMREHCFEHGRNPLRLRDRLSLGMNLEPSRRHLGIEQPQQRVVVICSVELQEEKAGHRIVELQRAAALIGHQ